MFNQEEANRKKSILQDKAFELHQANPDLALVFATGVGKARAAALCMQGKSTLIVYHQKVHYENWLADLAKHELTTESVQYTTYAGIHKFAGKSFDLVVFDECHHITPRVLHWAKQIQTSGRLFLSATVSMDKMQLLKQLAPNLKLFRVTLAQAIRQGILPQPQIFVKRLKLDIVEANLVYSKGTKTDPEETVDYWQYEGNLKYQKRRVRYNIRCTQEQYYKLITDDIDYWKLRYFDENKKMLLQADEIADTASRRFFIAEWYRQNEWVKNRWLQLGSARKRFLGESKTQFVKSFLLNETGRLLIFATSIEQCNELAGIHVPVHSKNKKDNAALVQAFNDEQTNRLYAVSMLTEGMNLHSLDKVYMVQLDGSKLQTVQKQGRGLRGEEPQIYIFLMSGTREEDYFRSFLEELDEEFCTYI